MLRAIVVGALLSFVTPNALFAEGAVRGKYVEARTCQVYTGPCFANGEVGSVGKDAIMVWSAEEGRLDGVDLSGCSVALVVKATHTLGFNGFKDARATKAILVVDDAADADQTAALKRMVLEQTGIDEQAIVGSRRAAIELDFDTSAVTATVQVGEIARLVTRKARQGDCICSNESAYYPPLAKRTGLTGFVPGVTLEGDVSARALGTRWSIPDSRTAYLGLFNVEASPTQVAAKL